MRVGLHDLAQSAATDGQIPAWDDANGLWVPVDPPSGGGSDPTTTLGDLIVNDGSGLDRLPVGTDGQILYADSGEALGVKWDAAPSGGGGGGVVLIENGDDPADYSPSVGDIIFEKAVSAVVYDFTTGALPAGWSAHNTPSAAFDGTGMTATFDAGDGYHCGTLPAASDFTVEMAMVSLGSTGTMFGPSITGSSGNGAQACWYNAPAGLLNIFLSSWSYGSSFTNNGGSFAVPNRIRLHKVGTAFYGSYSFDDGATWSAESASMTSATTPAVIGINSAFGSSTVKISEVVVRSNPARGSALGWWDGTQVQPTT